MTSRAIAVVLLGLAACGGDAPADPASLHARIDALVPEIVDETNAAATTSDVTIDQLVRAIDAIDVLAPGFLSSDASADTTTEPAPTVTDQTGQEVADELNTRLFTDANYEDDGMYRVPADMICPTDDTTGAIDPTCATNAAEIRIRAVLVGDDGVDFTLVLGAERAEPVTLGLRHRAVSVSVDLGELQRAATELGAVMGEGDVQVAMSGVVAASLEVLGTAHVSLSTSIEEDLHIGIGEAGADPNGDGALRIDSAVAQPLFRIELDGATSAGSFQLGLGSTQVHYNDSEAAQSIDVDLPGATATASLRAGEPLRVTGIGLGNRSTTLAVNGQTAMTVDLNRDQNRRFDLVIAGDALDATYTLSPAFDLRVATDHAVLGDTAPRFDVTRVAIDGAPAPALRSYTLPDGLTTQLQVAAGRLTIETAPTGYGVLIDAPSCVGEELRTDANGEYSVLVATACQ